jgi:hypothetical protein
MRVCCIVIFLEDGESQVLQKVRNQNYHNTIPLTKKETKLVTNYHESLKADKVNLV